MSISYATLALLLISAAVLDIRLHRIPNWLTVPGLCVGLLVASAESGVPGIRSSAEGAVFGGVVFLLPFVLGGMGGGDVKLMAAVGALAGWPLVVWAALLSCVVGLMLSVAKAVWQGRLVAVLRSTWLVVKNTLVGVVLRRPAEEIRAVIATATTCRVPFGVSISLGTLWALALRYLVNAGLVGQVPYL